MANESNRTFQRPARRIVAAARGDFHAVTLDVHRDVAIRAVWRGIPRRIRQQVILAAFADDAVEGGIVIRRVQGSKSTSVGGKHRERLLSVSHLLSYVLGRQPQTGIVDRGAKIGQAVGIVAAVNVHRIHRDVSPRGGPHGGLNTEQHIICVVVHVRTANRIASRSLRSEQ